MYSFLFRSVLAGIFVLVCVFPCDGQDTKSPDQNENSSDQIFKPNDPRLAKIQGWLDESSKIIDQLAENCDPVAFHTLICLRAKLSETGRIEDLDGNINRMKRMVGPKTKPAKGRSRGPRPNPFALSLLPIREQDRWKSKQEFDLLGGRTISQENERAWRMLVINSPMATAQLSDLITSFQTAELKSTDVDNDMARRFLAELDSNPGYFAKRLLDQAILQNLLKHDRYDEAKKLIMAGGGYRDLLGQYHLQRGDPKQAVIETSGSAVIECFFREQAIDKLLDNEVEELFGRYGHTHDLVKIAHAAIAMGRPDVARYVHRRSLNRRRLPDLDSLRQGDSGDLAQLAQAICFLAEPLDSKWTKVAFENLKEKLQNSNSPTLGSNGALQWFALSAMLMKDYDSLAPYLKELNNRQDYNKIEIDKNSIRLACSVGCEGDLLEYVKTLPDNERKMTMLLQLAIQSQSHAGLDAANSIPMTLLESWLSKLPEMKQRYRQQTQLDDLGFAFRLLDLDALLIANDVKMDDSTRRQLEVSIVKGMLEAQRWRDAFKKSLEIQRRLKGNAQQQFNAEMIAQFDQFGPTVQFVAHFRRQPYSPETAKLLLEQRRFECFEFEDILTHLQAGDQSLTANFDTFCAASLKKREQLAYQQRKRKRNYDRDSGSRIKSEISSDPMIHAALPSGDQLDRLEAIVKLKLKGSRQRFRSTKIPRWIAELMAVGYAAGGDFNAAIKHVDASDGWKDSKLKSTLYRHGLYKPLVLFCVTRPTVELKQEYLEAALFELKAYEVEQILQDIKRSRTNLAPDVHLCLLLNASAKTIEEATQKWRQKIYVRR